MTTDTHTKTALFFAYGTLRKGQRLHDWIADEVIQEVGMEQNAGYTIVEGAAEFDGVEYPVIVCEWRHEYGEPVTDNDWIADSRKEWW